MTILFDHLRRLLLSELLHGRGPRCGPGYSGSQREPLPLIIGRGDSQSSNQPQHGFTLLELVIAIAILGLIMTVAYASLSQIMRSKATLDDGRDGAMIANAVLGRMTHELQLILPQTSGSLLPPCDSANPNTATRIPVILKGESRRLPNGGRGDSLTFIASEAGQYMPDESINSGVVQITYRADRDESSARSELPTYEFIREEIPDIKPAKKACDQSMIFPITSRLTTLQFEYFDDQDQKWVDEWGEVNTPRANRLPRIIRFTVGVLSPQGKEHIFTTSVPIAAK